MGMILFCCGAALLVATVITALVFRAKPLRYAPQGMETAGGEGPAPAEAGRTAPMEAAATMPMGEAARTVPMDRGVTVPMEAAEATVPMDRK